jgi:hypothetical protein
VFTSDKDPNTISGESVSDGTLLGDSNSGEDVVVDCSALPIVVGDFIELENASSYTGIHRVSSIITGTAGVSVTRFSIDTPVNTDVLVAPNLISPALSVTVTKYYNNFSVVVDLYIENSFIVRLRKKRNANDEFVFDVSNILQEYLGSDLNDLTETSHTVADNLAKDFYIEYAEEYDEITNGINNLTLQSFTDDSANTFTAVNSTVPYVWLNDFSINSVNYDLSDFYSSTSPNTSTRFLTNQPSTIEIGSDESYQLSFIQGTIIQGGVVIRDDLKRRVITYDSSGSVIATTDTILIASSGSEVVNVSCGTTNLGATITAATVKYDVLIVFGTSVISETLTFNINSDCSKIDRRIEFVNKLGGLDAFTCKGKESKDMDIDKKVFKRSLNSSRVIPERSITTVSVNSKEVYALNTSIVSKEERDWLIEMIESPECYMVIDSYRIPIQITDKFGIEKLAEDSYNIQFEYEFAFDRITQRN